MTNSALDKYYALSMTIDDTCFLSMNTKNGMEIKINRSFSHKKKNSTHHWNWIMSRARYSAKSSSTNRSQHKFRKRTRIFFGWGLVLVLAKEASLSSTFYYICRLCCFNDIGVTGLIDLVWRWSLNDKLDFRPMCCNQTTPMDFFSNSILVIFRKC